MCPVAGQQLKGRQIQLSLHFQNVWFLEANPPKKTSKYHFRPFRKKTGPVGLHQATAVSFQPTTPHGCPQPSWELLGGKKGWTPPPPGNEVPSSSRNPPAATLPRPTMLLPSRSHLVVVATVVGGHLRRRRVLVRRGRGGATGGQLGRAVRVLRGVGRRRQPLLPSSGHCSRTWGDPLDGQFW